MQKPENYDTTEPAFFDGKEFERPTIGGHIFVIKAASEQISRAGFPMLVLDLDIAQGTYTGYFREKSERINKNCYLKYFQRFTGDSLRFYKGLISSIEQSNPGFKFEHNENLLVNKLVGGKLILAPNPKTEIGNNDKGILRINFLCPVDKARQIKEIPCPEFYAKPDERNMTSINAYEIPESVKEDVPF